jgi:hypothetical protein
MSGRFPSHRERLSGCGRASGYKMVRNTSFFLRNPTLFNGTFYRLFAGARLCAEALSLGTYGEKSPERWGGSVRKRCAPIAPRPPPPAVRSFVRVQAVSARSLSGALWA